MIREKWYTRGSGGDIKKLSEETGLSPILTKILCNRGLTSKKAVNEFLNAGLSALYDPMLLKDMDKGVSIVADAIRRQEKILIAGDYDADGITATCILIRALRDCGALFSYKIPHRVTDGYGININIINDAVLQGVKVLLTCDNGISAVEQVNAAVNSGIRVVITDHHQPPEYLPPAHAVIDTKRRDCTYPYKELCGAGIAYKFATQLYAEMNVDDYDDNALIELLTIGTICDVVELTGENRILIKEGLKLLNEPVNTGLRALNKSAGMDGKEHTAYTVGYVIGPCINATGRLEHADLAVGLLNETDYIKAMEKAQTLCMLNKERQRVTEEGLAITLAEIENQKLADDRIIIVYSDKINESVAGIIAGRLRERFLKPSIVLTESEGCIKGSARSVTEVNIYDELCKCSDILLKFGGHPMAAGISLDKNNINELRRRMNKNLSVTEELIPKIYIDVPLPLNRVSLALGKSIQLLEPYGKGNEKPIFADKGLRIKRIRRLGKTGNVSELILTDQNGVDYRTIAFSQPELIVERISEDMGDNVIKEFNGNFIMSKDIMIDICYNINVSIFNGKEEYTIAITAYRVNKKD